MAFGMKLLPCGPARTAWVSKPLYWNMDSAGYYILWMMQPVTVAVEFKRELLS
jgi:hypothetical protein